MVPPPPLPALTRTSDRTLGAHGKLTTCARIELTKAKPGAAASQVPENRASIRAAGAQVLPHEQTCLDRHHPARRCRVAVSRRTFDASAELLVNFS